MKSHIAVFETDMTAFARRTRIRLLSEFGLSVFTITALVYLPPLPSIPILVRFVIGGLVVCYFLYDLISAPASKRMAKKFRLYVYDDQIDLHSEDVPAKVIFGDIQRYSSQEHDGQIVEIRLETRFGHTIRLRGLQEMGELHKILGTHLPK